MWGAVYYPAIYSVHAPEISEREQRKCVRWSVEKFLSEGVTCVHDNFVLPRQARQCVMLEQQGNLDLRVRVYPYVANLEQARNLVAQMRRYRGPLVRMQGVKLAVDGYALMYDVPPEHQHLAQPMPPRRSSRKSSPRFIGPIFGRTSTRWATRAWTGRCKPSPTPPAVRPRHASAGTASSTFRSASSIPSVVLRK